MSIQTHFAPFQGTTDHIFRKTFHKHFEGITHYYTPFFNGFVKKLNKKQENELSCSDYDLIPQILSKDPNELIQFAKICSEKQFRMINWNLGCPFARIINKKRGAGLLPFPGEIFSILEDYFKNPAADLSIKCRLGLDKREQILPLMKVFNQFPLKHLIIHGRTATQMYDGKSDWEYFETLIQTAEVPLVYNGDIFHSSWLQDKTSPVKKINGLMLGRGLLANPFLAEELIRRENMSSHPNRLANFLSDLLFDRKNSGMEEQIILGKMKELWWYLSKSFVDTTLILRTIRRAKKLMDLEDIQLQIINEFQWHGKPEF